MSTVGSQELACCDTSYAAAWLLNNIGGNVLLPYNTCFAECKIQQRMGSTDVW